MIREFNFHVAWVDVMKEGSSYIGLIEYQSKLPCPLTRSYVQPLWVFDGRCMDEYEAKYAAMDMLNQIDEITFSGRVVYKDGVTL